jgi:hypothetical protein
MVTLVHVTVRNTVSSRKGRTQTQAEIFGSQDSDYEEYSLPGCDAV